MKEEITKEKGFTLLEIMISMVILAIGLLALSSMQGTFATGNAQSRQLTHAINLASSKIEELKQKDYNAVGNDSSTIRRKGREYVIDCNVDPKNNSKQVQVVVTWNNDKNDFILDWTKAMQHWTNYQ